MRACRPFWLPPKGRAIRGGPLRRQKPWICRRRASPVLGRAADTAAAEPRSRPSQHLRRLCSLLRLVEGVASAVNRHRGWSQLSKRGHIRWEHSLTSGVTEGVAEGALAVERPLAWMSIRGSFIFTASNRITVPGATPCAYHLVASTSPYDSLRVGGRRAGHRWLAEHADPKDRSAW